MYPHPFFPNVGPPGSQGHELCKVSPAARFVDTRQRSTKPTGASASFAQDPISGYISRRLVSPSMGYLEGFDKMSPMTILLNHNVVGMVAGLCSYAPDYLPIWGNEHAFSWEPFVEAWLGPGESYEWSIDYVFCISGGNGRM